MALEAVGSNPITHPMNKDLVMDEVFSVNNNTTFSVEYIICIDEDFCMTQASALEFSVALADAVLEYIKTITGHYDLVDRIERSAQGVSDNIRKAGEATDDNVRLDRYHLAMRDSYATEYWIGVTADMSLSSEQIAKKLMKDCVEMRRKIYVLINEVLVILGRQ